MPHRPLETFPTAAVTTAGTKGIFPRDSKELNHGMQSRFFDPCRWKSSQGPPRIRAISIRITSGFRLNQPRRVRRPPPRWIRQRCCQGFGPGPRRTPTLSIVMFAYRSSNPLKKCDCFVDARSEAPCFFELSSSRWEAVLRLKINADTGCANRKTKPRC